MKYLTVRVSINRLLIVKEEVMIKIRKGGRIFQLLLILIPLFILTCRKLPTPPDGTKILFVAQRPHEGPMVWVMDADGSNPVPLAAGSYANWSPSGEKIIYTSRKVDGIWIMDANGCNKAPFIGDFNFLEGVKG